MHTHRRPVNLARLDLVSIRLAVLCAESGSLSAAARCAGMSLSRASYRLSALESALGMQLFERCPQGLHPTAPGTAFASYGRQLLQLVGQMERHLRQCDAHPQHAEYLG